MLKKLVYVAAAAALLMGLFFGRDAASYVSTAWKGLRSSVRDNIPVHVEIARAEEMIKSLDGPIEATHKAIATEEVEIAQLSEQVRERKEGLAEARRQILQLNEDLQSGNTEFVYNDKVYTVSKVKQDLAARFDRFRNQESTTHKMEQILDARQQGLAAAEQKLTEMLSAKRDLEVKVEHLKARQKLVEAREAGNDVASELDDSKLTRTKELVNDIQKRIEVAEKMVDTRGEYGFEIDLSEPSESASDITDQVTDYFGEGRSEIEALVSQK